MNESGSRIPTLRRWAACVFSRRVLLRCLFVVVALATLFGLFHAVENWRGSRALRAYRAAVAGKNRPMSFAEVAPARVPDPENFAVTPFFNRVFEALAKRGQGPVDSLAAWGPASNVVARLPELRGKLGGWRQGRAFDLAPVLQALTQGTGGSTAEVTNLPPAVVARQILDRLAVCDPVLDELRVASARPHSRFDLDYSAEDPFGILLPHLAAISGVSKVVLVRALAELAAERPAAAADDVEFLLRLADALRKEPLLISQLVRLSIVNRALEAVWEGGRSSRWTDAEWARIGAALGRQGNLLEGLALALRTERAATEDCIRILRSPRRGWFFANVLEAGSPSPLSLVPDGWIDMELVSYHRWFDRTLDAPVDVSGRRIDAGAAGRGMDEFTALVASPWRTVWSHSVLAKFLLPASMGTLQKFASTQDGLEMARVAAAIGRWRLGEGRMPTTLDALVPRFLAAIPKDVVTGQPIRYVAATDGSYALYTAGWNEKDEGGRRAERPATGSSREELAQGDWVWSYAAGE